MVITIRLTIPLLLISPPLAVPLDALAVPITYTITGNANITFGGGRSGDTPFTIRATGDTADIVGTSIRTLENLVATVQVSGFPEATLTNANNSLQVNNANSQLTFSGARLTTIELTHPTFSTFNLATNRGPIFFPGALSNTSLIFQQTTAGPITIAGLRNVTFTSAVPEPSGIALLVITMGWLFGRHRR